MSNVTCVRCGLLNRASAEMCQQCGAELVSTLTGAATSWQAVGYAPEPSPQTAEAGTAEIPTALDIGPFYTVSTVVSPTIDIFKNNVWLITKIVLVIFAPYEIVKALSLHEMTADWTAMVALFFMGIFCKTLAAPALIYALMRKSSTGVAPGLNEAYRFGLSRMGRIVPASLMAWILTALGIICFIVPGILLSLSFEPVGPIATLEEHSPVETLKRSYHLTKGYRGRIFGAGIIISLLASVVSIPVTMLVAIIAGGNHYWLLNALSSMLVDVLNAATIILSLMVYLSLIRTAQLAQEAQEQNGPLPL